MTGIGMDEFIPLVNRAIFSKKEHEASGGEITEFINKETKRDLADGQVYMYLQKMCRQDLLEKIEYPEGHKQFRVYYRITHNRPGRDKASSPVGSAAPKTA